MVYASPQAADLKEVYVLNKTFLAVLSRETDAARRLGPLPGDLAARLCSLSPPERRRLAAAPFLLFSVHESDDAYWDSVYRDHNGDLFTAEPRLSADRTRLVSAALGYLWQMARRNPYMLRVICGATLHWCERLGDQPLMHVIDRACAREDILELRAGSEPAIWKKLLETGLDRRNDVRAAAHSAILHFLIIQPPDRRRSTWKSAACRTRVPAIGVAEDDQA